MTGLKAQIGLIGGSGFYQFFGRKVKKIKIRTKFGFPGAEISLGRLFGRDVAFLPRHGEKHQIPPHKINYRANIAAFKKLGVSRIIAPAAVGSLNPGFKPGDFVFCDQFIDQTKNRKSSFFDGPKTAHIAMAYPYCSELRKTAIEQSKKLKLRFHSKGTVVVIEGPRFSTIAESLWFSKMGADLINMTQVPEAVLAAEAGICYLNVSLVTDYDVGVYSKKKAKPVSIEQVLKNFNRNMDKLKKLVSQIIGAMPLERSCGCQSRAEKAII